MRIDVFFDSNVVLHMFGSDVAKADRSQILIRVGGVVSVQVLNECAVVARRKMRKTWPETHEILAGLRAKCAVTPLTLAIHDRGLAYAERYQFALYDSMIVSAAVLAGCTTLFTEDMQDGLVIDGLTIRNPYAVA